MPKIFDCFMFFAENDVLEIRLKELEDKVDQFILVQSDETFRGKPKLDYLDYDRFKPYIASNKLMVYTTAFPRLPDPWAREKYQRNAIRAALASTNHWVKGEDTIIISDVDEIPRASVVEPVRTMKRLRMRKFSYGLNIETEEGNTVVRMLPHRDLTTPQEVRYGDQGEMIEDAGWEFSSLGTPEEILRKLQSFSHSEFDVNLSAEVIARRMNDKQDIVGRNMYHEVVPIDESWPVAVTSDLDKWSKYIW